MVFGFIKQSGGHINVYSEVGVGTSFRLYMPRVLASAEAAAESKAIVVPRGNGERILVVEDEPAMRCGASSCANSTSSAIARPKLRMSLPALSLLEADGPFDLLFSDVVMAGKADGFDLARHVAARWPATKIVMTSGFPDTKTGDDSAAMAQVRLLSKPYSRADLAQMLHRVLRKSDGDAD